MRADLSGRVALVTGAASGIGRATAQALAEAGARLALADRDADGLAALRDELAETGAEASAAVGDLSTGAGVERAVAEALAPYDGRVDVLFNNVGAAFAKTLDELDDAAWERTLQLNLMSQVRTVRHVLPAMRAAGRGAIVNMASDLARQPEVVPADYAVSKVAVVAFTKALARAEAPAIRVNAVAPGPVWTPLWTAPGGFAEKLAELHGMEPEAAVAHELSLRQLPLGRLGTPEEVANVVVFLASDLASFVTSSVWGVDGGSVRGTF